MFPRPGFRQVPDEFGGPVVCVAISSGFKDIGVRRPEVLEPDWTVVRHRLLDAGLPC